MPSMILQHMKYLGFYETIFSKQCLDTNVVSLCLFYVFLKKVVQIYCAYVPLCSEFSGDIFSLFQLHRLLEGYSWDYHRVFPFYFFPHVN